MEPSLVFKAWFACVFIVGEPIIKNNIPPNKNKVRLIFALLLFFIS